MDGNEVANTETLESQPTLGEPQDTIQKVPDVSEVIFQTPDQPTRRGYRSPSPSQPEPESPTLAAEEPELELFKATLPKQRPVAAPLRGGGLDPKGDTPKEVDDDPYLHVPASADDSKCDT